MVVRSLILKLFYLALKYKVNLEGNMDHLTLQVLLLPSFSPSSLFVVAKIHRVLSMHFCILLEPMVHKSCTQPCLDV